MKRGEEEPFVNDILANLETREMRHLVDRAAKAEGVTVYEVVGRSRAPSAVRARRKLIASIYLEHDKSTVEVGTILDLDHTSVMYALEKLGIPRRRPGLLRVPPNGSGRAA